MKIYLAARYGRKDEIRHVAELLKQRGHFITSSWVEEPYPPSVKLSELPPAVLSQIAKNDIEEILNSEALIFFAEDPEESFPRGGRHVEFGIALSHDIPCFVVGPKETIFTYLCPCFDRIEDLPVLGKEE